MEYYIKEQDWKRIFLFLQNIKSIHKSNEGRLNRFIEAVWYIVRTGCPWRLLPSYYGKWRTIHARFISWSRKGIWDKLFENVIDSPDLEYVMIDTTIVRAHSCAAGYKKDSGEKEALGRSRGGFTTKIHAIVDALGNPLKFLLSPGQQADITLANELLKEVPAQGVIGDKGFDADELITELEKAGKEVVIPPKSNRKKMRQYDKHIYKERHLIECFFNKIKQYRRVFSRFDKCAKTYLSIIHFVATLTWLK